MYRRLAPVGHALAVQRPPVPTCGWGPATASRSRGRSRRSPAGAAADGSGEHGQHDGGLVHAAAADAAPAALSRRPECGSGRHQEHCEHQLATRSQKEDELAAKVAWVIGTERQGQGDAREAAGGAGDVAATPGRPDLDRHVHLEHEASKAVARALGLAPTETLLDGEVRWEALTGPSRHSAYRSACGSGATTLTVLQAMLSFGDSSPQVRRELADAAYTAFTGAMRGRCVGRSAAARRRGLQVRCRDPIPVRRCRHRWSR